MFWDRFHALCISKGKSPNVVASEIGIKSSGTVTGWKNGALPRMAIVRKLADYFGVTAEYLLTGENKKTPSAEAEDEITMKLKEFALSATPDELRQLEFAIELIKSKRGGDPK